MRDVWLAIVSALLGAMVGVVASYFFPGIAQRLSRRPPVWVHVETDPARIWSGFPPWVGAGYLVPVDLPVGAPPSSDCPTWWQWARGLGAADVQTHILLTVSASGDRLVVIDGLDVKVHSRRSTDGYRVLMCPVGGADLSPRRLEVRLAGFPDTIVMFVDEAGDRIASPAFSVSKAEAERFQIWAVTEQDIVEWSAELRLIVDGERTTTAISNGGKPFVTGASTADHHIWDGTAWSPPL